MSPFDRVVLYVGVLVAVVFAVLSWSNSRKPQGTPTLEQVEKIQNETKALEAQVDQLKGELKKFLPMPVAIAVKPIDCPSGTSGTCCVQDSDARGVDKHGNPIVHEGDSVSWVFVSPGVSVKFPPTSKGCPFPSADKCTFSDAQLDHVASAEQVKLAASGYEWPYQSLTWANSSCQHVVEPLQDRVWPPGLVMRPPP
jgi:hypothetical protein